MSVWERVLAEAGFAAADDPVGADGAWTDRGLDDSVAIDDLLTAATVGLQLVAVDAAAAIGSPDDDGDADDDLDADDIAGGVRQRSVVGGDEPVPAASMDESADIGEASPVAIDLDALSDPSGESVDLPPVTPEFSPLDDAASEIDDDTPDARAFDVEEVDE